jgi:2,4-didehydro-3-deoxy-L-rhamnonate hydrolase
MWLTVNGETRQKSSTGQMVFDVGDPRELPQPVHDAAPRGRRQHRDAAGVGLGLDPPVFLKAGDVVELGIEGLGRQRQRVVPPRS